MATKWFATFDQADAYAAKIEFNGAECEVQPSAEGFEVITFAEPDARDVEFADGYSA